MEFKDYQIRAKTTAIYPREMELVYPALGLAGETGEAVEKIKKYVRDGELSKKDLMLELGDVLWYLSNLASDAGILLEDIATENIKKLISRKERNVLHGEGDNR